MLLTPVIVEHISSKELYIVKPKATVSHHQTSKHQCMSLGLVPNLNNPANM